MKGPPNSGQEPALGLSTAYQPQITSNNSNPGSCYPRCTRPRPQLRARFWTFVAVTQDETRHDTPSPVAQQVLCHGRAWQGRFVRSRCSSADQ